MMISTANQQRGSVLAISLLILVVLTIVGVSGMTTSSLEEKMAGNFRDRQIAFQAAETTIAYAEEFVRTSINSAAAFNSSQGFYKEYQGPTWQDATDPKWWTATKSRTMEDLTVPEVKTQPRFTIEFRGDIGQNEGTDVNMGGYGDSSGGGKISSFRVTARATGLSDNTVVILQSYYGKRL